MQEPYGHRTLSLGTVLNSKTGNEKYRADIDGLRAIAIILVLVFHAFPSLLPGGFVGVDVFFVISGYLITGILQRGFLDGSFRFSTFYYRRARRILPALFAILLFVLLVGPIILFSSELRQLGKHVLSSLTFTSNFRLLKEAGYFDTSSEAKPLLHLWSLAVEEQFYLFLPWVFAFTATRRRATIPLLGVLTALSLGLNLWMLRESPAQTFYLPYTRFWEIFAGGLLAAFEFGKFNNRSALTNNIISITGAVLLFCGVFICGKSGFYPNISALLPVGGTIALIGAGSHAVLSRHILSLKALVYIGLISYPLYLWHWPLLVFANLQLAERPTVSLRVIIIFLSFVLAILTYRYLEKRIKIVSIRFQKRALITAVTFLSATAAVYKSQLQNFHPLPSSITNKIALDKVLKSGCYVSAKDANLLYFCEMDVREPPTVALWGDSKAGALFPGVVESSVAGNRWLLIARPSCSPLKGLRRTSFWKDDGQDCARANQLALTTLLEHNELKTVLIAPSYRMLFLQQYADLNDPSKPAIATDGLLEAIADLRKAGKRVFFLIDNPTLKSPEFCAPRYLDFLTGNQIKCSIAVAEYKKQTDAYQSFISKLKLDYPDVKIFDPTNELCDLQRGICPIEMKGEYLYSNDDHLSDAGALRVAKAIVPQMVH